jgi:hypothetical protein
VELWQPALGRADVQRYTNRETCGFSVFFHGPCREINAQALPSCGPICNQTELIPVSS